MIVNFPFFFTFLLFWIPLCDWTQTFLHCALLFTVILCSYFYCAFLYRHALITVVSHNGCPNVLFTVWDLICSLISSVVTHLTLKHSLSISFYLAVPTVLTSLLPTGELEVADSVWEDVLHVCLFVCVFWMLPLYICTCMSLCVCTACVSVNVCDRCQLLCQGWGRTLPSQPRCLQRFVSTQQIKGEHLLPLHTHTDI